MIDPLGPEIWNLPSLGKAPRCLERMASSRENAVHEDQQGCKQTTSWQHIVLDFCDSSLSEKSHNRIYQHPGHLLYLDNLTKAKDPQ